MTGNELDQAINNPSPTLPAFVEEFLYAKSVFMLTGAPGKGKSIIATQLAVSLTTATKLFGTLYIPQPRYVYYMQMEGLPDEQFQRLHTLRQEVPLDTKYLYWDAVRKRRLNVMDKLSVRNKLDQITHAFTDAIPELIVIDPIYKVASTDLAKAEPALALIDFCDTLLDMLGCSIMLLHHPHREGHDMHGKIIQEDDSYYGHSFLKNYIDTSYLLKQSTPDGSTSQLIQKKRREEKTIPIINLIYHPETLSCSMLPTPFEATKADIIEQFLANCARANKQTDFYEVQQICQVSSRWLRIVQNNLEQKGLLKIVKKSGFKNIWIPKSTPSNDQK